MSDQGNNPVAAAVEVAKSTTNEPISTTAQAAEPSDPKLAAYEKKERQLRQMMKQFQTEKQSFEQQRQQQEQEYKQKYVPRDLLSNDPLAALQDAGITTEKLTELLLNAPNSNDPTIRALRAEISAIKDQQQRSQQQAEESVKQQYEQAKKQITTEVKLLIDSKPEDFEAIREEGLHDAVVELIEDTFNREGYLMDAEEAARQIENYLVEKSLKLSQLKKVQSRLKPDPSQAPEVKPQAKQISPTLTNSMTSSGTPQKLSEKERRERAIAAFMGKLNN